tara:strand:+ start:1537 stop:3240 length:1704 start_codon:yes stop_codon:yes gene_type:complete
MNEKIDNKDKKEHWFWGSVRDSKAIYVQMFLASLFINFMGLMSVFYIMTVYDRVIPNSAYSSLIALTIGMGVVIIFDFIIKMLRSFFVDVAGANLEKKVSNRLFKKISSHDHSFLSKRSGIIHTVREFEGVRDFFTSASMVAFIDLPFMFVFIGVIYMIAGPVAVVPLLIVPLVFLVAGITQPLLKKYSKENLQKQSNKMNSLAELVTNVETVRTIAGGDDLRNKWNDTIEQQTKTSMSARSVVNFAVTFAQSSLQVSQTAIVCYGVVLIGALEITSGALVACVILSGRVLSPLVQAGTLLTRLNTALAAYKKVDDLMLASTRDEENESNLAVRIRSGEINISNLSYMVDENEIINNINFQINDGEKVGVIGNLGCGKTTLLRNLIGFYEASRGDITIGGYDIKNIPASILRKDVGYVPQTIQLFSGTIYDNIVAGFDEANEEDVIEACDLAGAHKFIGTLPGGYNYNIIDNGGNLSGGQRQSIALARCLLRKPKIMVLDEPTSSMDNASEERIINNLFNLDYNPTIVISTHKLSYLLNVDKVALMVDGKLQNYDHPSNIIKVQNND